MKQNAFLHTVVGGALLISAATSQAATVSLFTGGDVGEGIDFSGNVIHAINIGAGGTSAPAAADLTVSGIAFKDAYASSVLIPNVAPVWSGINNFVTMPN